MKSRLFQVAKKISRVCLSQRSSFLPTKFFRFKEKNEILPPISHEVDETKLNNLMDTINKMVNSCGNSLTLEMRERVDRLTAKVTPTGEIIEPEKPVPVLLECDVLVVGGGPAGLSAAIAAKRALGEENKDQKMKEVCLLDYAPFFGGTITKTGVETMGWYRYEGTVESDGIGREIERKAEEMRATSKWPFNDSVCLDAHHFKRVADKLLQDEDVTPLLCIRAVEVIMDSSGVLLGVITESESGRQAILAQRVVDATGNATVAHLAGAPYHKIRREDSMDVTTIFSVVGVDCETFFESIGKAPATYEDWNTETWNQDTTGKEDSLGSPYWGAEFDLARELGVIPEDVAGLAGSWSAISPHGEATCLNLVHMSNFDCTDQLDLTQAEMLGRENAYHAISALRATVPGFEDVELGSFSAYLGTRDSRYIASRRTHPLDGVYVASEGTTDDSIGIFPEFVDGRGILMLPTSGRVFEIPYGIMLPQNVDNLVVAGRAVDVDLVASCALRNMMACTVTGQAAGVAAAVSILTGENFADVDIALVQEELRRQGVSISKDEVEMK